jgi:YegS/Rv2252/BmrU family lipid kinase
MRRVSVIYNPSAGGGRAWRRLPEVQAALEELGLEHRATATTDLEHAEELGREAAANEEVAATLGGDGLVGRVAGALRGTDAVLGVLPGGRGNDLARVLGIPSSPAQACRVLAQGVERPLDLGEVDGRTFIGIASCGFDSDANRIANEAPASLGNLVYAYGALRALLAWRPADFELELDGATHRLRGWSVAAANSKAYGGGMYLAPGAALDDGRLDVVCSSESGRLRFLANLPRVFRGTHVADAAVEVRRAREVTVRADRPFVVYADGDPIGELPVTIRAVPGAVRVLMPADADPSGTGPKATRARPRRRRARLRRGGER